MRLRLNELFLGDRAGRAKMYGIAWLVSTGFGTALFLGGHQRRNPLRRPARSSL